MSIHLESSFKRRFIIPVASGLILLVMSGCGSSAGGGEEQLAAGSEGAIPAVSAASPGDILLSEIASSESTVDRVAGRSEDPEDCVYPMVWVES